MILSFLYAAVRYYGVRMKSGPADKIALKPRTIAPIASRFPNFEEMDKAEDEVLVTIRMCDDLSKYKLCQE